MGRMILNGTVYGAGSKVEANPSGTATDTLQTVDIDGTIYEIQGGSGGGSNLIVDAQIYSEDEQEVGVWIDGKPLYQKTIIFSNSYQGDYNDISINTNNIDTICHTFGFGISNGTYIPLNFTNKNNNSDACAYYFTSAKTGVNFRFGLSLSNVTITIQYTKTTDAAGSGGYQAYGFSPIIYSETEREIGVWTDNKPLYVKTFYKEFNGIERNTFYDVADCSSMGIENLVELSCNCRYIYPSDNIDINVAYDDNMVDAIWQRDQKKIQAKQTMTSSNLSLKYWRFWVTILYTKTTDTAGSGSYNTLGVPTVHYDTNEQVIGTWMDKPLYQKTIQVSNKTCNSTGFVIDTGLTNVKKIIDEKITIYINQYSEEYLLPYYRVNTSEEIIPIRYLGSSGVPYLQVRTKGANYGACSAEATLQYTKTTD